MSGRVPSTPLLVLTTHARRRLAERFGLAERTAQEAFIAAQIAGASERHARGQHPHQAWLRGPDALLLVECRTARDGRTLLVVVTVGVEFWGQTHGRRPSRRTAQQQRQQQQQVA